MDNIEEEVARFIQLQEEVLELTVEIEKKENGNGKS